MKRKPTDGLKPNTEHPGRSNPSPKDAKCFLISGPPASGKTAETVRRAARAANEGESVLVVLPTRPAADRFVKKLIEATGMGLANARTATLEEIALETVQKAPGCPRAASRALSAEIISLLARRRAANGKLSTLREACRREGFGPALHEFIRELLEAGAQPDDLRRAPGASERLKQIADLFEDYSNCLAKNGLFDAASVFGAAVDSLRAPFAANYDAIFVDGFTRLSRSQVRFLAALAENAKAAHFSIPLEAGAEEPSPSVSRMLELIRSEFNVAGELTLQAPDASPLRTLWESMGAREHARGGPPPSVEVLESPGPEAEIETLAVRAKQLIVDEGLRPDEICVILRGLDGRSEAIRRIFAQIGVPCEVAVRERCLAGGAVRSVLSLLRAVAEGLPRERVCDLLRSRYFSLGPLGVSAGERRKLSDAFDALSLRAGLSHCDRDIRETLEELRARLALQKADETDEDYERSTGKLIRLVDQTAEPLGVLIDLLREFGRRPKSFGEWLRALETLLGKLGFEAAADSTHPGEIALKDLAAWEALARAASEAAEAASLVPGGELDVGEFSRKLSSLAERARLKAPEGKLSALRVLNPEQAAPLRFAAVLVGSLVEGVFPGRETARVFLNANEAAALASAGVRLPRRRTVEEEAELFRHCLARADDFLALSFSYIDDQARPLVKSAFLKETIECLHRIGAEPLVRRKSVSAAVPDPAQVASPRHLRRHLMWRLFRPGRQKKLAPDLAALCALSDDNPPGSFARAAHSILVENRRWREGPCDSYDGVLDAPAALDAVRGKFPAHWTASPGRLGVYGRCPFCFFVSEVLGVEEEEERLMQGLSPIERGLILHQALSAFFRGLDDDARSRPAEHAPALHAAADKIIGRFMRSRATAYRILWDAESKFIHAVLDGFLEGFAKKQGPWVPARFEVAFGLPEAAGPARDGLRLSDADLEVTVRGRIDRIDERETPEGLFLRVVDYKTKLHGGHGKTAALRGEDLQVPLYMIAASEVVYAGRPVAVAEGVYVGLVKNERRVIRVKKDLDGDEYTEDWKTIDEQARLLPVRYLARIRAGRFPVAPRNDCANGHCPYKAICRMSEARMRRKGIDDEDE